MGNFIVKNKRLKMSPGGIITLPVSARKALGMRKGERAKVAIAVDDKSVILSGKPVKDAKTWPMSEKGQMHLKGDAKAFLTKSKKRHYWLELDDKKHIARLMPF